MLENKKVTFPAKGRLVHAERDEFGLIQVIDTSTTRSLYFDSPVEQSRLFFQAPMTLAFEYQQLILDRMDAFSLKHPVNASLMLGLGGGTLTNHLHCLFPKAQHHLVELRQAVIDIAYDYFFMVEDPNVQIHRADAFDFVMNQVNQQTNPLLANPPNIILVDLYDGQSMPEVFCEPPFLEALLALKPAHSVIIFNLWSATPKATLKVIKFWEKQGKFRTQIRQTQATGNVIFSVE